MNLVQFAFLVPNRVFFFSLHVVFLLTFTTIDILGIRVRFLYSERQTGNLDKVNNINLLGTDFFDKCIMVDNGSDKSVVVIPHPQPQKAENVTSLL